MKKKLTDKRMGFFLFLLCWLVYFTSYIGRLNYSSVIASIKNEGILTLSQAGSISMMYFFAYGIGQLVNGILGDKAKPQLMIFIGLFCSGFANLLMGCVNVYPLMLLLWGINGYTQAMIWPPIIRIFAEKYTYESKMKYSVDIVSSMAVGTLTSYFLSACAMHFANWKFAFYIPAIMLTSMALIWIFGYRHVERFLEVHVTAAEELEEKDVEIAPEQPYENSGRSMKTPFKEILFSSGLAVILLPVMIHGVLKDGVTQWVPTYIYERFEVTASFSVVITMILPLINLSGAYLAKMADRRHPKNEVRSSIVFFTSAVIALVLLLGLGKYHVLFTAVLFAVITASMMAVNVLFVNLIPLHFEQQGRVSTVSGFLNSVAYIGSAVSTFTIGVLVEKCGWNATILTWIGITVLALLLVIAARKKFF